MIIRIGGSKPDNITFDETIHHIDVWYSFDPEYDGWVIQCKNIAGDQIGAVDYDYLKKDAIKTAKKYNLPIFIQDRTTNKIRKVSV